MSEFADALGADLEDPEFLEALEDAEAVITLTRSLVRLRLDQNLNQTEVAERMETTQSAVSDFERLGGDPRISTFQRYARAVGACVKMVVKISPDARWSPPVEVMALGPERSKIRRPSDVHGIRISHASSTAPVA